MSNKYILLPILILISACAPTSNYYTGRTLKRGESIMTAGVDNLMVKPSNFDYFVEEKPPFTPSFGYARGLPYRFEAGFRIFWPYAYEGNLRYELTPDGFSPFDMSLNTHFGKLLHSTIYLRGNRPFYLKLGTTISRQFAGSEPFIGYYKYYWAVDEKIHHAGQGDIVALTGGIAIPIKGGFLIPELNYQFPSKDVEMGFIYFGIGFRINK